MKRLAIVFTLSVILFFGTFSSATAAVNSHANENSDRAPVYIPGSYIVVLKDGFSPEDVAKSHGLAPTFVYKKALNGFAAHFSSVAAEKIQQDSRVKYVEQDQVYTIAVQELPTGVDRINVDTNAVANIDGVDDRVPVVVAVIDTGVDIDHPDLYVSPDYGIDCSNGFVCWEGPSYANDDHDHGTHVAGIIAALDNGFGVVGVAPGAEIVPVKVLKSDGSGSLTGVLAGIDYVTLKAYWIDVANMSLTGGFSTTFNNAVAQSVAAGVVYVVAAGNDAADASNYSPASEPAAITVSAIADFDGVGGGLTDQTAPFSSCTEDKDDSFACFSNYGSPVDIAAPGVWIYSTVIGGYDTHSGTSMASPHVAGAAALVRSQDYGMSPAEVKAALLGMAIPQASPDGFTGDPDGNSEPLLSLGPADPPNQIPIANAGNDQSAGEQAQVFLDGTSSYDPDEEAISYSWSQTSGPPVTINNPTTAQPSFTTPTVYDDAQLGFSLVVNDGHSNSAADEVLVSVSNSINEAPTADAGGDQVISDFNSDGIETVILDASASFDMNNDTLTFQWSDINGPLAIGKIVNHDFSVGVHNVTLRVTDFYGDWDEDTELVTVTHVNSPPVAADDNTSVDEAGTVNVNLASNDTDADDGLDLTSIQITSGPTNGAVTVNADGTVDYEHDGSETVSDSFTYTIDDNSGTTSNTATVSITITPVNDPPVAADDNTTVDEAGTVSVDVLANDSDADSTPTIDSFTQPTHGTVSEVSGQLQYTHDGTENFVDSFDYTITDGILSDTATVSITVIDNSPTITITEPSSGTIEGRITVSATAENFSGLLTFWLEGTDSFALGTVGSPYSISFHTKDFPSGDYLITAIDSDKNQLDSVSVTIPSKSTGGNSSGPDCTAKPNHPKCQ